MAASVTLYTVGLMEKATVTASSTKSGTAAVNVLDQNPNSIWSPNGAIDGSLTFDLGSAKQVDGVAIFINNYTTPFASGASSMLVEYSSNGSTWTTFETVSLPDGTTGPILFGATNLTAQTKRYWKLTFQSMGAEIKVGLVMLYRKWAITVASQWPNNDQDSFLQRTMETGGGFQYVQPLSRSLQLAFTLTWVISGTTSAVALQSGFRDCQGQRFHLLINRDGTANLVRFDQSTLMLNETAYQIYNPTVSFVSIPYIEDGETI